jgi:hypothetical protein
LLKLPIGNLAMQDGREWVGRHNKNWPLYKTHSHKNSKHSENELQQNEDLENIIDALGLAKIKCPSTGECQGQEGNGWVRVQARG